MKGRRRARRAALQALYELDLTDHDPDRVIAQRIEAMASATLSGRLAPHLAELARSIVGAHPPFPTKEQVAGELASSELSARDSADVAAALADLAGQAAYAVVACAGVRRDQESLDRSVARIAPEWPVDQMAPVDRNILRIAIWEIATDSAPVRVAINEAVELARQFSGEGSRRLVNGALGTYVGHAAGEAHPDFDTGAETIEDDHDDEEDAADDEEAASDV
jgi:N utilization substance protein B